MSKKNSKKKSQTLLKQRNRLGILFFQIPIPDPMHPRLQPLPDNLQITPHALGQHTDQMPRLPRRLNNPLTPRLPHLIIRREHVRDEPTLPYAPQQRLQHERVLDRLSGALALEGSRGVSGIAHHRHVAEGVCGGGEVVAHGPDGQGGAVEEGDEVVGFLAPVGEEAVEVRVGGGHDPFVAFPRRVLEVQDYYVGGFAEVDGVAQDGFALGWLLVLYLWGSRVVREVGVPGPHRNIEFCAYSAPNFSTALSIGTSPL